MLIYDDFGPYRKGWKGGGGGYLVTEKMQKCAMY